MFNIIPPGTQIDFAGKRHVWLSISCLAVLFTIYLLSTRGLNFGIDFTGGAEIHARIPAQWDITQLRQQLTNGGLVGLRVQQIGEASQNEYLIRAKELKGAKKTEGETRFNLVAKRVQEVLASAFPEGGYKVLKDDEVGPAAGSVLRINGLKAMFFALLVILIYVAIRFDSRYAPGAVLALFHDSMIVLGIFTLTQKQFDLSILAAMLALVGYSNNDTIIVFDRVRETLHMFPELSIKDAVNRAINETLGRTIVTSLTTFFVVSALWWYGGPVLENFAFTLMCGVAVGTYSSVFIASSLIIELTQYQIRRANKLKASGKKKKRKQYSVRPEPRLG